MQTIVIGGGISGLACAYRLRQWGHPVLLLEQAPRVGGVIDTVQQEGFLFELGPQSFLSTDLLLELTNALGLARELLRANPRAPRYVLSGGRLQCVPMTPGAFLTSSLLGVGAKLRLISELFRKSQPPDTDESVADFVRRKFGEELLENLVAPFVSGIYAGDPEKLSLRSAFPDVYQWEKDFGSVIRGAIKSQPPKQKPRPALCSFTSGVVTLVRALGEKLGESARCGVRVESVCRGKANGKSTFELQVTHQGRTELLTASAIVVATQTHSAARLLARVAAPFPEHFAQIEYARAAVVAAGYRREQIAHPTDGFGFLVARKERRRLLGSVWNSSLFPGRAPEGMVNFTSFAGGATDPHLCELSDAQIAETILQELTDILKISGPPVTCLVRRYVHALPQYNLGHAKTIASLRELCTGAPGLFLTGNYFEGPSIGVCVENAFCTADSVRQYLASISESNQGEELHRKAILGSQ